MLKWSVAAIILIVSLVGAEEKGQASTTGSAEPQAEDLKFQLIDPHDAKEEGQANTGSANHRMSTATAEPQAEDPKLHLIDRQETHSEEEELKKALDDAVLESSEESKGLKAKISDDTGKRTTDTGEQWEVSLKCLDCLCYFATDCDMNRRCETPTSTAGLEDGMEKGDCGPFHISFPFWADANRVNMDTGDAAMENEWKTCSLNLMCATESIQKYFHKYPNDCNGDGKVDCLDYAAIHTLGPYGCMDAKKLNYWNKQRRKGMLKCMAKHEEGRYITHLRELQEKLKRQDIGGRKMAELESKKKSDTTEDKIAAEKFEEKTNLEADHKPIIQEDHKPVIQADHKPVIQADHKPVKQADHK